MVRKAPADISDRDVVAVEAVSDEKTSVVADLASAVAYLDANSVWKKEDMESNAVLVGLFDDMNNYRMERLKNHWAEVLKDSKNFAAVAKAARMGAGKRDPRTGNIRRLIIPMPPTRRSIGWDIPTGLIRKMIILCC